MQERIDEVGMILTHSMLAASWRRLRLPGTPQRFFEAVQSNLRAKHLKIFLAYQNEKPKACPMGLRFMDQWISEYSENADGAISGVNKLLHLETIRMACAQGAQKFGHGRTSNPSDGLVACQSRRGTIEEKRTDYFLPQDHGNETPDRDADPASDDSRL
jgi:hypothetical protein